MDVRRILLLRLVATHGSISAAARAAGWTQPALSQHIRALETEAGMPLLIRASTGVRLTEAGETLVGHADAIAAHLSAADQQIANLGSLQSGRLRIAAFPSAIAGLLPEVLAALRARIPRLDLHLIEAEPPQAIALLTRDEVDAAIVFTYADDAGTPGPAIDAPTEFAWQPWRNDHIHLVVPAGAAERRGLGLSDDDVDITVSQCEAVAWIAGCERCQSHLVGVAQAHGFTPRIWHETDDTVSTQALVAAGHGIALLPSTALATWRHPGVSVLARPELGQRHIGVLTRPALAQIPAVRLLRSVLSSESDED